METDRRREEEWFAKNEQDLLKAAREAREKRERDRITREKEAERQRLRELHFMKCPKCGHDMKEEVLSGVTIERCQLCEGIFFDAGELEQLSLRRDQEPKGILRKLVGL